MGQEAQPVRHDWGMSWRPVYDTPPEPRRSFWGSEAVNLREEHAPE
jgi:hypothetical protein